ncbi:MAG: MerR family transcriptional regulator [Acholeplasmataceae bacterium]|nr:MerR family transcriptional regulator [Acholeplasmataceae bacterium]
MKYLINELAKLASISTRTLRYYDQIGLLHPSITSPAGYRFYSREEVNRLQQIMFLKTLDIPLKNIKEILDHPEFDHLDNLKEHLEKLQLKKKQLNAIISTLTATIEATERNIEMKDKDKFVGFKKTLLKDNDALYKDEVEQKWGKSSYEQSRKAFESMSETEFQHFKALGEKIVSELKKAYDAQLDYMSLPMQKVAKLHQEWIQMAWGRYDADAHYQLVEMYVVDERFKVYYDKIQDGLALLLKNAVQYYLLK